MISAQTRIAFVARENRCTLFRTMRYRPNNRLISQPSSPLAGSGRTAARDGVGLPATEVDGGFAGAFAGELACAMVAKKPLVCEAGSGVAVTP